MYTQASSSTTIAPLDFLSSPLITYIPPIRYDDRGRQIHYVESTVQRQERVAFIRKREWARRVSAWVEESQSVNDHYNQDVLYDSAMVRTTTSAQRESRHLSISSLQSTSGTKPKVTWDVLSIPESTNEYYDDNEPYIIYSSSSPSSPSSSSSVLSDEAASPSSSPTSSKFSSRRSPRPRRRHLSLSSINEEPEEV
jgi:hypothetical protein